MPQPRAQAEATLQSATGIQAASVRQFSKEMTGGGFNAREFFHHAAAAMLPRVRLGFQALLFVLPALLLAWALLAPAGAPWLLALASMLPGLAAERWFFVAQARHPQNLYYQVVS